MREVGWVDGRMDGWMAGKRQQNNVKREGRRRGGGEGGRVERGHSVYQCSECTVLKICL